MVTSSAFAPPYRTVSCAAPPPGVKARCDDTPGTRMSYGTWAGLLLGVLVLVAVLALIVRRFGDRPLQTSR
jgi:hypothetical protein